MNRANMSVGLAPIGGVFLMVGQRGEGGFEGRLICWS